MAPIPITLIAAATLTNGIGKGNTLPWRLSKEMAYFAKVTLGSFVPPIAASTTGAMAGGGSGGVEMGGTEGERKNVVIMGRKSWEGIPTKFRPLKGRRNVVVSRQTDYDLSAYPDTHLSSSLPASVTLSGSLALPPSSSALLPSTTTNEKPKIFLIGGAQLYTQSLTHPDPSFLVNRILLTRIKSPAFEDCDAFFPEFRSAGDRDGVSRAGEVAVDAGKDGEWRRASHKDLEDFVGFEVVEGDQKEKDVVYEFQMWVR